MSRLRLGAILVFAAILASPANASLKRAQREYQSGALAEQAGRYQNAVSLFRRAWVDDPNLSLALQQQANCYYYLGESALAVRYYDAYLAAVPGDQRTRAFDANLKLRLIDSDGALLPKLNSRLRLANDFQNASLIALGAGIVTAATGFGVGLLSNNFNATIIIGGLGGISILASAFLHTEGRHISEEALLHIDGPQLAWGIPPISVDPITGSSRATIMTVNF